MAGELALDGRGRLLDVGCGPGTVVPALAPHFAEVVGADPDRGMLAEARRLADAAGLADRTGWVRARAEELPLSLGTFSVVTFGQSFHWMDRDRVAATVLGMLPPGGAFPYAAPHLFGDRLDSFTADLKRLLRDASPSGRLSERVPSTEVFVWRKPLAEPVD